MAKVKTSLARAWERLLSAILGLKCQQCGVRGASLVVYADKIDQVDRDGLRTKTFRVRGTLCICRDCRQIREVLI